MPQSGADILSTIIAHKREEVAAARKQRGLTAVKQAAQVAPPPRDFFRALTAPGKARVIAECKRQSPSRGILLPDYDPVSLAQAYERGGAAAISVLTDERFFGGCLLDLERVRASVQIPVMRKEFIIDEYQIYEARAAGADSFLLLSGVLSLSELQYLLDIGRNLGMEPLIESHTAAELDMALRSSGKILGVNNRDLKSFKVSLDTARSLLERVHRQDPARLVVCESGIHTPQDVRAMEEAGYRVFLVGEALVKAADPEHALRSLIAH